MSTPHKFLFEQSFDLPESARAAPSRKPQQPPPPPPPPPEPTFSAAELAAAREAGLAEGRAAALAEAAQSTEAQAAGALSSVALGIKVLLSLRGRFAEEAQHTALTTLRAVLAKALPALCRKAALVEIEALVAQCLREAFDEPRVVLRIAEGMFETLQPQLNTFSEAAGFSGKLVLLTEETLSPTDARVEWAEGGAERDTRRLIHDIDGALARALDSLPAPGSSPPKENGHE
jgi:flagellar assembly protein FliH